MDGLAILKKDIKRICLWRQGRMQWTWELKEDESSKREKGNIEHWVTFAREKKPSPKNPKKGGTRGWKKGNYLWLSPLKNQRWF